MFERNGMGVLVLVSSMKLRFGEVSALPVGPVVLSSGANSDRQNYCYLSNITAMDIIGKSFQSRVSSVLAVVVGILAYDYVANSPYSLLDIVVIAVIVFVVQILLDFAIAKRASGRND